jgi:hypothetical protein
MVETRIRVRAWSSALHQRDQAAFEGFVGDSLRDLARELVPARARASC